MKPQTTMIHGGGQTGSVASLTTPIYETTTYLFDTAAEVKQYAEGGSTRFLYSRYGNPTVQAVERTIAALEGAESALLLSSGAWQGTRSGRLAMPASPSEKPPSWPMKLVRLLPWPPRKPPKLPLVRRL